MGYTVAEVIQFMYLIIIVIYYFFELAQNRPYSLSTFQRVTFDFLYAKAVLRSLKVMKDSFVNIMSSL